MLTDDEVIASIRKGNSEHFSLIIERYKSAVLNFIHKMIFDYESAENLAQDTFLKAFQNVKRYRTGTNFHAYLFTIAKNLTLNHIKREKRTNAASSLREDNPTGRIEVVDDRSPESRLHEVYNQQIVVAGLRSLPENQRIALIMKVYLDYSYKKISAITGWSISKIETLISRGRSRLKRYVTMQERSPEDV